MKKIAIVQDWFTTFAGTEKIIQQLLEIFPGATLFSLIDFLPQKDRGFLKGTSIHTSFLQNLPFVQKYYQRYLALMPLAIEQLDLSGYDLVISNCHAVSKGVITGPDQLHISYLHTPIRYAWDMQNEYLHTSGFKGLKSLIARAILHYIRIWDMTAASRPDRLIANSNFIAKRIQKIYRRDSDVIYPPVDTVYYTPSGSREDFYLTASRLVPYKRVDLIAKAFQSMPEKKLVIIGDGSEARTIQQITGPNITWLGYQPDEVLKSYMQRCKAFIFAAKEDFGITPIEAQACGTPVIAYGEGGVRETVTPATGIHFPEQSVESIQAAVRVFDEHPERFQAAVCRENAERFSTERFRSEFSNYVHTVWDEFKSKTGHA